tara:strand:+ start:1136 stop:1393 length:258 start_codon:yes stop_codon:yes gene_type:complete
MKSENVIKSLTLLGDQLESPEDKKTIMNAILEITRLNDENQSVWDLIEEMKASDIKNYREQAEALAAEKILSAMALNRRKTHESN